jgi:hypothetical protein
MGRKIARAWHDLAPQLGCATRRAPASRVSTFPPTVGAWLHPTSEQMSLCGRSTLNLRSRSARSMLRRAALTAARRGSTATRPCCGMRGMSKVARPRFSLCQSSFAARDTGQSRPWRQHVPGLVGVLVLERGRSRLCRVAPLLVAVTSGAAGSQVRGLRASAGRQDWHCADSMRPARSRTMLPTVFALGARTTSSSCLEIARWRNCCAPTPNACRASTS